MSTLQRANHTTFSEGFRILSSSHMFDNVVLLAWLPLAVAPSLVFDQIRLHQSPQQVFVLAALAYLVPIGVIIALRDLLVRNPKFRLNSWWTLGFLLFAGFTRGATIYSIGNHLGWIPASDFYYRFLGAPVYVGLGIALIGALNVQWVAYRAQLIHLNAEQTQLSLMQTDIRGQIESQQAQLVGRIQGLLAPAIYELNRFLSSSQGLETASAVAKLNNTLESVVRPLSHFAGTPTRQEPREDQLVSVLVKRLQKRSAKVNVADMIGSAMIVALTVLFTFMPAVLTHGWFLGPTSVAIVAIIVGLFALLGKYLSRNLVLPVLPAAALIFVWQLLAGWIPVWLHHFVDFGLSHELIQVTPYMVAATSIPAFVNEIVKAQRQFAITEFERVNEELSLLNSRLRQEVWLNQRRTANILHGPIQGAIYASAIRLSRAKKISKKLIEEIQNDINSAVAKLTVDSNFDDYSFEEYLSQIIELWQDIATFTLNLDRNLMNRLKTRPLTSECLLETVREAVSNAIRHGKATEVAITITGPTGNLIQVQIENNGIRADASNTTGFGTKLLNEITHDWSLTEKGSNTVFEASVVLGS